MNWKMQAALLVFGFVAATGAVASADGGSAWFVLILVVVFMVGLSGIDTDV